MSCNYADLSEYNNTQRQLFTSSWSLFLVEPLLCVPLGRLRSCMQKSTPKNYLRDRHSIFSSSSRTLIHDTSVQLRKTIYSWTNKDNVTRDCFCSSQYYQFSIYRPICHRFLSTSIVQAIIKWYLCYETSKFTAVHLLYTWCRVIRQLRFISS